MILICCSLIYFFIFRILNDHRKKCIKEMKLAEAIRAQLKFDDLKAKETLRQM